MSTPTPNPTPTRGPLRGLAVGVLLMLILFPAVRALATTTIGVVIAIAAGAFIALFVCTMASVRK